MKCDTCIHSKVCYYKEVCPSYDFEECEYFHGEQPTGEWERDDEHSITFDIFKCSHCGGWGATFFRYCPKCGARMKGGEDK